MDRLAAASDRAAGAAARGKSLLPLARGREGEGAAGSELLCGLFRNQEARNRPDEALRNVGEKGGTASFFCWGFFFFFCSALLLQYHQLQGLTTSPFCGMQQQRLFTPRPSLGSSAVPLVAEAPRGPLRLLSQPSSLNLCHPSHLARRGIPWRAQGAHPAHEIQQRGGDGGVRLHGVVHHQDGGLWKERAAACTPCALPIPSGPALCPRGAEGNPFLCLLQPFSFSSS